MKGGKTKGKWKSSPLRMYLNDLLDDLFDDLLDDLVEVAIREHLLDLPLNVTVWRNISNVGSLSGASTTCEHPKDMAVPSKDDGARVAGGGERSVRVAIREDCDLD